MRTLLALRASVVVANDQSQADSTKIKEYIKPYKMARSFDQQLIWMKSAVNG